MRNYLITLILLATAPIFSFGNPVDQNNLTITLSCAGKTACIFNGEDIPIEITIKNTSPSPIGFPQLFVQKTGPFIMLTDAETGAKYNLRMRLADHELMTRFTEILPGDAIKITTHIINLEITKFRKNFVDLTAEIGYMAGIKIPGKNDTVLFNKTEKIKIIGKDTIEREGKN